MILRQHALEVREVAGQLAAQQQPLAELEEQMIVIARRNRTSHPRPHRRPASESRPWPSAAAARETTPVTPGRSIGALHHRQAMPIGRHHRQALALQQQQRAVQREPRLLHRDREDGSRDHRRQQPHRDLRQHSGICGSSGKLSRDMPAMRVRDGRTPDSPNGCPETSLQVGIRKQPHIIQQASRRNRTRTLLSSPAPDRNSECPAPDPWPSE